MQNLHWFGYWNWIKETHFLKKSIKESEFISLEVEACKWLMVTFSKPKHGAIV